MCTDAGVGHYSLMICNLGHNQARFTVLSQQGWLSGVGGGGSYSLSIVGEIYESVLFFSYGSGFFFSGML